MRRIEAMSAAWLIGVMLWGCAGAQAPASTEATALDPADSVHVVLTRWYDAFASFDSAGVASPLAEDFLLVEDTTLVTREALLASLMGARGKGHQTAELRDFHTVMEPSVAWTTFRNHEEWIPSGGSKGVPVDFIETVVFRKQEGAWRIARYHATKLHR